MISEDLKATRRGCAILFLYLVVLIIIAIVIL